MGTFGKLLLKNKHQYDYTKLKELVLVHKEFSLTCTPYAHFQSIHNQEIVLQIPVCPSIHAKMPI